MWNHKGDKAVPGEQLDRAVIYQDPAMASALTELYFAQDVTQARVALNILKVIWEHEFEHVTHCTTDALETACGQPGQSAASMFSGVQHRRWLDANQIFQSVSVCLQEVPDDMMQGVLPHLSFLIEESLANCFTT
jgi:hypothetical protein